MPTCVNVNSTTDFTTTALAGPADGYSFALVAAATGGGATCASAVGWATLAGAYGSGNKISVTIESNDQWFLVDSTARTVYLDGAPSANFTGVRIVTTDNGTCAGGPAVVKVHQAGYAWSTGVPLSDTNINPTLMTSFSILWEGGGPATYDMWIV